MVQNFMRDFRQKKMEWGRTYLEKKLWGEKMVEILGKKI